MSLIKYTNKDEVENKMCDMTLTFTSFQQWKPIMLIIHIHEDSLYEYFDSFSFDQIDRNFL